jgi:hypothetical protein
MPDELTQVRNRRERVGRALDKKLHERGEKRVELKKLENEQKQLIAERKKKKQRDPKDDEREAELDKEIAALHKEIGKYDGEIEEAEGEEKDLTKRIKELRGRNGELAEKEKELEREKKRGKIVVEPGAPHWMGCEDIIEKEVVPAALRAGAYETSGKRSEDYGNPGSDHHTSQTNASARDFGHPQGDYCGVKAAIADELDIGSSDYAGYYIERAGHTYRVQQICANHGTGPHEHTGLRFVA